MDVGVVGERTQISVIDKFMRGLGYEPQALNELPGLSGLRHKIDLIGVNETTRHVLIGHTTPSDPMYYAFSGDSTSTVPPLSRHPYASYDDDRPSWLRETILASYDTRAALESDGWICDSIFLLGSFAVGEHSTEGEELPDDVRALRFEGYKAATPMHPERLAAPVRATGAAFVDCDQLSFRELARFAQQKYEAVAEEVEAAIARLRLREFLSPPTDELIVGAVDHLGHLRRATIAALPKVARRLRRRTSPNVLVPDAPHDDVIATLESLKKHSYVEYEREEVFTTPQGKMVRQRFSRTPQESFLLRLLRELRLSDILDAILKNVR
jgi:hypothetical protein